MPKKCIIADRHEKMGKDIENCIICGLKIGKSYKQKLQEKVALIPIETKQRFIDIIHSGKTIGEAEREVGIGSPEGGEILLQNIGSHKFLRTEAI